MISFHNPCYITAVILYHVQIKMSIGKSIFTCVALCKGTLSPCTPCKRVLHPFETQFSYFSIPQGIEKYENNFNRVTTLQGIQENKVTLYNTA